MMSGKLNDPLVELGLQQQIQNILHVYIEKPVQT